MGTLQLFAFIAIVTVSVFSFISIAVWVEGRRKEREAYYKNESMRRITELPPESAQRVIDFMREEAKLAAESARAKDVKSREGVKIGGLVNLAVGLALMIFLHAVDKNEAAYLVGLIPAFVGAALLIYAYLFAPKLPAS